MDLLDFEHAAVVVLVARNGFHHGFFFLLGFLGLATRSFLLVDTIVRFCPASFAMVDWFPLRNYTMVFLDPRTKSSGFVLQLVL
jgi:hypothetical protein